MDREPRSYLIEVLRAVHAGAGREELGDLLREAFGPSTSAMVTPGKWTMLREKFATYLTAGSAAVLSMSNEERALALAYKDRVPSHQEQRAGVVFAALFAHILAFASGEL
jgi:hypothetical protein